MDERIFSVGDTVYAWSNERYGKSYLVECDVEEVCGNELLLYAGYDNRSFYRNRNDVMGYDELMECVNTIIADHNEEEKDMDNI